MPDLNFEDREIMDQVLREAVPSWSRRECQCFILQMLGYTQEQAARMLGVGQPRACKYLARAMGKVREVAKLRG